MLLVFIYSYALNFNIILTKSSHFVLDRMTCPPATRHLLQSHDVNIP